MVCPRLFLEALERRDQEHPLLAVFLPYRVADRQRLRREGPEALARIEAAPLPPRVRECLSDVLFSWLTLRFSDQSYRNHLPRPASRQWPGTGTGMF